MYRSTQNILSGSSSQIVTDNMVAISQILNTINLSVCCGKIDPARAGGLLMRLHLTGLWHVIITNVLTIINLHQ